jgi:hypothetical protein
VSRLVLLGGPPNPNLELVASELARQPGVRRIEFEFAAMLARLREATEHRAAVWRGVNGRAPEWIAPAVVRFGARIVEALQGEESLLLAAHVDNARRIELLASALPQATFVVVLHAGRDLSAGDWLACVEPVRRAEAHLGSRLVLVRDEELVRDSTAAFAALCGRLELASTPWSGAQAHADPAPGLTRDARHVKLEVLAALQHFGYDAPDPMAVVERRPELLCAFARSLLAAGRLDEAAAALEPLEVAPDSAVHTALGLLAAGRGREREAAHAFLRAIQADVHQVDAWIELFAMPHRSEPCAVAEFARHHQDLRVRAALARWLVARGLDAEAAEIVAHVEHQPWRRCPNEP